MRKCRPKNKYSTKHQQPSCNFTHGCKPRVLPDSYPICGSHRTRAAPPAGSKCRSKNSPALEASVQQTKRAHPMCFFVSILAKFCNNVIMVDREHRMSEITANLDVSVVEVPSLGRANGLNTRELNASQIPLLLMFHIKTLPTITKRT